MFWLCLILLSSITVSHKQDQYTYCCPNNIGLVITSVQVSKRTAKWGKHVFIKSHIKPHSKAPWTSTSPTPAPPIRNLLACLRRETMKISPDTCPTVDHPSNTWTLDLSLHQDELWLISECNVGQGSGLCDVRKKKEKWKYFLKGTNLCEWLRGITLLRGKKKNRPKMLLFKGEGGEKGHWIYLSSVTIGHDQSWPLLDLC